MEHFVPCQAFWNISFYSFYMSAFSERLYYLRREKEWSRAFLAGKLCVSVRQISYWECGQRECDFEMLVKIADLFDVSVDFLLGRTNY